MKYTEKQVLEILELVTDQPQTILDKWHSKYDNTKLDLSKYEYPLFLYSFPIVVGGEEVATITLAEIQNTGIDSQRQSLMTKYLTSNTYQESWWAYSHDTYLDCYLTIHKEFELPKICEGMNGDTQQALDANGTPFQFTIAYGYPEKEEDSHLYYQWADGHYRFNNDISIKIDHRKIEGWSMGKKINEVIDQRTK